MNNRLYGNLIFELSKEGRKGYSLPKNNFGTYEIPASMRRSEDAALPECDELTVVRHYTNLSNNNFGVDTGFYPLGSCTIPESASKTTCQHRSRRIGIGVAFGALALRTDRFGPFHLQTIRRCSWRTHWSYDDRQLSPFTGRPPAQEGDCAR